MITYHVGFKIGIKEWSRTIRKSLQLYTFLRGALWDIFQMHCGICEMGLFIPRTSFISFENNLKPYRLANECQTMLRIAQWLIVHIKKHHITATVLIYPVWMVLTHWGRGQNCRHFADDIFKRIFLNENMWISLKISLKFIPKVQINNIPASVQIMAWGRTSDKPLSEPMMVSFLKHICVTQPQWVKWWKYIHLNSIILIHW